MASYAAWHLWPSSRDAVAAYLSRVALAWLCADNARSMAPFIRRKHGVWRGVAGDVSFGVCGRTITPRERHRWHRVNLGLNAGGNAALGAVRHGSVIVRITAW